MLDQLHKLLSLAFSVYSFPCSSGNIRGAAVSAEIDPGWSDFNIGSRSISFIGKLQVWCDNLFEAVTDDLGPAKGHHLVHYICVVGRFDIVDYRLHLQTCIQD